MLQHGWSLLHNKFLKLLYLELDLLLDRDLERDLDLSAKNKQGKVKIHLRSNLLSIHLKGDKSSNLLTKKFFYYTQSLRMKGGGYAGQKKIVPGQGRGPEGAQQMIIPMLGQISRPLPSAHLKWFLFLARKGAPSNLALPHSAPCVGLNHQPC